MPAAERKDSEEWVTCPSDSCPYEVHPADQECQGCGTEEGEHVWVQQKPPSFGDEIHIQSTSTTADERFDMEHALKKLISRTVIESNVAMHPDEWQDKRFGYYCVQWLGLLSVVQEAQQFAPEDVEDVKKKSTA